MEAQQSKDLKRGQDSILDEDCRWNHLLYIVSELENNLSGGFQDVDSIRICGSAPLEALERCPDEVLDLARKQIHAFPFHSVPMHWRRLFEEASLRKAIVCLRNEGNQIGDSCKALRLETSSDASREVVREGFLTELVRVMDTGISLSGSPRRKGDFEYVFDYLTEDADILGGEEFDGVPRQFTAQEPPALDSMREIQMLRATYTLSLEAFQLLLDTKSVPVIVPSANASWPASTLWHDPTYFLRKTLGGRRYVPVEIGKSYTDPDWSQTFIPFGDFLTKYVLPEQPEEVGYLAQHDLFAQLPSLKNDIVIPDYCYSSPPSPVAGSAASKTAGLAGAEELEEPLLNAWLGPKGTRTPLHTDPYHNILCQIVGYKYVRLYSPEETERLYPYGRDSKGIDMANTSQVNIGAVVLGRDEDAGDNFPLFEEAKYLEGILGPGECLYVPLGWWHYVESLSVSISVSFWFN